MESINTLHHWLSQTLALPVETLTAMPQDASFRQYYRLQTAHASFVVMDASRDGSHTPAFISIARALRAEGLLAPDIIASNLDLGFLLLTDFGDETYLKVLKVLTNQNVEKLYQRALDALVILQGCRSVEGVTIPLFTVDFMQQEWAWHKEWFLGKYLGLSLGEQEKKLDHSFTLLAESAANQTQVFMHRDYHSGNLMMLPEGVGILDFQDAFIGPVTYDLVSLLRDCYIAWPETQVEQWALAYLSKLQSAGCLTTVNAQTFLRWFDWMGVERHLKALFTFARKAVRDGEPRYLQYMPRTLNYALTVSAKYPELAVLHEYLQGSVQDALVKKGLLSCAQ